MRNTIKLGLPILLLFVLAACSSSDDSSGVPPDSSVFNITIDGQEVTMLTGFDHMGEENCWSNSSGISITEDDTFLDLEMFSLTDTPDPDLFFGSFSFDLISFNPGSGISRLGDGAVSFDWNGSSYYNYEPEFPDSNTRRIEITTSAINFNVVNPEYTESTSQVAGGLGLVFTTLDDMQSHDLNIDFDLITQDAFSFPDVNNSIIGRWVNLSGCTTAAGTQNYFQFNADGTGQIFNADCTSSCANFGYTLNFNYQAENGQVDIVYTSGASYCGATVPAPSPESLSYTVDGDRLNMAGTIWTRQ